MMTYIYISVNLMNDLGYSTILFWLFEVCEGPVAATASGPTIYCLFDRRVVANKLIVGTYPVYVRSHLKIKYLVNLFTCQLIIFKFQSSIFNSIVPLTTKKPFYFVGTYPVYVRSHLKI